MKEVGEDSQQKDWPKQRKKVETSREFKKEFSGDCWEEVRVGVGMSGEVRDEGVYGLGPRMISLQMSHSSASLLNVGSELC